jgi:hypothetical protein
VVMLYVCIKAPSLSHFDVHEPTKPRFDFLVRYLVLAITMRIYWKKDSFVAYLIQGSGSPTTRNWLSPLDILHFVLVFSRTFLRFLRLVTSNVNQNLG